MYHGSCAPGSLGEIDVSVIRDCYGRISTLDWSPCDAGIENIGVYWERLFPANTVEELYQKQDWQGQHHIPTPRNK